MQCVCEVVEMTGMCSCKLLVMARWLSTRRLFSWYGYSTTLKGIRIFLCEYCSLEYWMVEVHRRGVPCLYLFFPSFLPVGFYWPDISLG